MGRVAIVVLAAGAARRFGSGKLDAELGGRPLGLWATETAGTVSADRFIVCPPQRPSFVQALRGWTVITNAQADHGIGTSIKAALGALDGYDRIVVTLADMPFVPAALLRELAQGRGTLFTRHPDGRPGVPAAFDRDAFAQLAALPDDSGAARIASVRSCITIQPDDPNVLADVDTKADLDCLAALLPRPAT